MRQARKNKYMNHKPIKFGVQRADRNQRSVSAYQKQAISFDEALDDEQKLKILERDNHSCQYCGFKSKKYQKILFKDGDMNNKSQDNLQTVCFFCHQCFHLDMVSTMKSGALIWLPEISQTQLHNLARCVYVARISQGPMMEVGRSILDMLMERRKEAEERISTDDPYILATVLKNYMELKQYEASHKKLEGIRLLPLDRRIVKEGDIEFNQWPQILAYWRSKDGPFSGKLPNTWLSEYKALKQAA